MPGVARVLREQVQRLAERQAKAGLTPIKRDTVALKKHVAELRRELAVLTRTSGELLAKVTAMVATTETEVATERAAPLRPTSKCLARLRRRLAMTQVEFGSLLGVSGLTVLTWKSKGSRVRMRSAALAGIQKIGKREARRRLERVGQIRKRGHESQSAHPRRKSQAVLGLLGESDALGRRVE
jgi:DNA-binding transcriptional regulator YiaG